MEFDFINYISSPEMTFIAILLFFLGFSVISLSMSKILSTSKPYDEKIAPYECGVAPAGPMPSGFALKYAAIAIVFLLFDIELIFLYPWAVSFKKLGPLALYEISFFILMLVAAYVIIWKKGIFKWK